MISSARNLLLILLFPVNMFAQWVQTTAEFSSQIHSLAAYSTTIFAGTGNGMFRSFDGGLTWDSIGTGLGSPIIYSIAIGNNKIYAGTWNSGVFVSGDNGTTWTQSGLSNLDVKAIAIQDSNIFAGTWGNGIYFSTNEGATWQSRSSGIQHPDIWSLDLDPPRLVASALDYNYPFSEYPGIYYSSNYGLTWTKTITGLPDKFSFDAAFSGTSIFVTLHDYGSIYRSTDNGQSWNSCNNGFPSKMPQELIRYMNNNDCYLFAGCYKYPGQGVVYFNKNDESSWHNISGNLPEDKTVYALAAGSQYLFAGLENTIWRRYISDIISSVDQISVTPDFNLKQNYPNPFNPGTTIRFSMQRSGVVQIKIYNILGDEIEMLLNRELPAGTHEIEWNAKNNPSGLYIYQMISGEFIEKKKMMLIK